MNIFQAFEDSDIVRANPTEVSTGLWTGDTGSLTVFYTSSAQTASLRGQYEWDIYNNNPQVASDAEVQFAIAYGNFNGGGASTLATDNNAKMPTQATYFQYRNILLEPGDQKFTFLPDKTGTPFDSDEIFVINIARTRLKEELDPGNWLLILSGSSGSTRLIDDSGQTLGEQFGHTGQVFNVVSGSLTGISGSTIAATSSVSGGFGLVYPSVGIIVLNVKALEAVGAIERNTDTSNPTVGVNNNLQLLFNAMNRGGDFQARSAEHISSTHFFVRLRNTDFNYTNNPTFFNETDGTILNPDFIRDPQVYVTTVGLYNDKNELLAVAKLSQPLRKAFDREALIRVRLDF
jgi:hypothetical protein